VRRLFYSSCVLGFLLLAGCNRGDHPQHIVKPAPDFSVTDGGQTVNLAQYRGKVVVLNFWATWCAPCLEEIPSLNALQKRMPGVVVLAVSVDQDAEAYRQFLAEHQIDFLTIRDGSQHTNQLYGTVQFPETYIIDGHGRIRRKFISSQDWTSPEILGYLANLEKEPSS
jgi:peroxiredoxin